MTNRRRAKELHRRRIMMKKGAKYIVWCTPTTLSSGSYHFCTKSMTFGVKHRGRIIINEQTCEMRYKKEKIKIMEGNM